MGEEEYCDVCYGAGTHGTGQSGIGDVTCQHCNGTGYADEKHRGHPSIPYEPSGLEKVLGRVFVGLAGSALVGYIAYKIFVD